LKPHQFLETVCLCLANKFTLMGVGPPGCGKTDISMQGIRKMNADVILMHPVVDDPTDYKGFPFKFVDPDTGLEAADFLAYGNLRKMVDADKLTGVIMDDMGQAAKTVQAAAMQLVWGGTINGKKISDKVSFIMLSNRRQDKAAVTSILEPLKNRSTIVHLETDVDDWCRWGIKTKQPPENIAFNRFRPRFLLEGFKATSDFLNSATPRSIARCGEFLKAGIPKEIEFEIFEGTAGKEFASEFMSFLRLYRELPDINSIIRNPEECEVPTKDSVLYAVCEAIATRANRKNFDNIIKFSKRISEEFMMMMIRDSIAHNKNVQETESFIQWQIDHQDVLLFTGNE